MFRFRWNCLPASAGQAGTHKGIQISYEKEICVRRFRAAKGQTQIRRTREVMLDKGAKPLKEIPSELFAPRNLLANGEQRAVINSPSRHGEPSDIFCKWRIANSEWGMANSE